MHANYNAFNEIALSNIQPTGWLRTFLQTQKEGLTGHLDQAGFPFDRIGWDRYDIHTRAVNENPEWWVYEQTAYWIDGIERCGQLLQDASLLRKSTANFDYVMKHTDADGYMGPKMLKFLRRLQTST